MTRQQFRDEARRGYDDGRRDRDRDYGGRGRTRVDFEFEVFLKSPSCKVGKTMLDFKKNRTFLV